MITDTLGQITSNATALYVRDGDSILEIPYSTMTSSTLVTSSVLSNYDGGFTAAGSYLYAATDSGTDVRRYDATTGATTLVAGSPGTYGCDDGSYYSGWFNGAQALVSDGQDTLYVADTGNNRIRAITEASPQPDTNPGLSSGLTTTLLLDQGTVSTFAGSGTASDTNGTGTAAAFNAPDGEAIIGDTLYVLDADEMRAVNLSTGQVTSVTTGGYGCWWTDSANPADVKMCSPVSLTTDGRYLYFTDYENDYWNIRRTDPLTGATTTVATRQ